VRLTKRGSDYLKASIITALISSILDVRITLALAFSLVLAALVSQLLLASASKKNIGIEIEKIELTVFKEEAVEDAVRIVSRRRRFIDIRIDSILGPEGVDSRVQSEDSGSIVFSFRPHYAGRFEGITITFALSDPLRLFERRLEMQSREFVIRSLPRSLLVEPRLARPVSLSIGERTGRTSGHGQEFYTIDDYKPSSEKRSIYWKKVAQLSNDKLVVKVRESNIPKRMHIGLVSFSERAPEEYLMFMDTACEGAASLSRMFLVIGCEVSFLYSKAGEIRTASASDLEELKRAIMEMASSSRSSMEQAYSIAVESDVCIAGLKELEPKEFAGAFSSKPSLLVSEEGANPWLIGDSAIIFSGVEDVGRIVNRVVGK